MLETPLQIVGDAGEQPQEEVRGDAGVGLARKIVLLLPQVRLDLLAPSFAHEARRSEGVDPCPGADERRRDDR
jgi:hypothetical protein